MLPARLDTYRTQLRGSNSRTPAQQDLLDELEAVSKAIDEAIKGKPSIEIDLKGLQKKAYGTWGGSPGKCDFCGK